MEELITSPSNSFVATVGMIFIVGFASCRPRSHADVLADSGSASRANHRCVDSLTTILASDSTRLERRTIEATPAQSTGGVTVHEYKLQGHRVRLVTEQLGETGRVVYDTRWASAQSYVLHLVDETYSAPLSSHPPQLARMFEQFFYVCDGVMVNPDGERRLQQARVALAEADSLLR